MDLLEMEISLDPDYSRIEGDNRRCDVLVTLPFGRNIIESRHLMF